MARRGRCRCGCEVEARRGPGGYKTRCPNCEAVVRLRRSRRRRAKTDRPGTLTCPCGAVVVLDPRPDACPCCGRELADAAPVAAPPRSDLPECQGPVPVLDLFEESRYSYRPATPTRIAPAAACTQCGEPFVAREAACAVCGAARATQPAAAAASPTPPSAAWDPWSAPPAAEPLQYSLARRILKAGAAPFRWLLRK